VRQMVRQTWTAG